MDADLKIIKNYLELALKGRPVQVTGDVAFEINDAFNSLGERLANLEIAERRRQPLKAATPTHGLGAVGGE